MDKNLFQFSDYKEFLREKISFLSSEDRSFRARLCQHVQCQQSYLSQVLNGDPNFTLEQALRITQFLHLDSIEKKYLLLLVERSRAGTKELEHYFSSQISEVRSARFNLKKRLRDTEEVNADDQNKYYSSWFYSAIYVMLSIPEFQSAKSISERLHLPEELVADVIHFLKECGLIGESKGRYWVTKKRLHLNRESIFIQRHHINWRSQALQSAEKNLPEDLHFSTVVALSKDDFDKIKDVFVQSIAKAREIINPSPEEEVIAITLDVFKL